MPFAKAAKEWQWGLFHVTMPRTFFIDSPGEFCAGQHACAGVATNAWSFAGVAPAGTCYAHAAAQGSVIARAAKTCTHDTLQISGAVFGRGGRGEPRVAIHLLPLGGARPFRTTRTDSSGHYTIDTAVEPVVVVVGSHYFCAEGERLSPYCAGRWPVRARESHRGVVIKRTVNFRTWRT